MLFGTYPPPKLIERAERIQNAIDLTEEEKIVEETKEQPRPARQTLLTKSSESVQQAKAVEESDWATRIENMRYEDIASCHKNPFP